MNELTRQYLLFSSFLGIGPVKFDALLAKFGSIKNAYSASKNNLKLVLGEKLAQQFTEFRDTFDEPKVNKEMNSKKITYLCREDPIYPVQLREISDAPLGLFIKGDVSAVNFNNMFFFGVVGTRKPSDYGREVTKQITGDLVRSGITTVSGLAYGIDAIVHKTTLDHGGKTIAFLGCGVDIIYPYGNKKLYDEIENGGGLVISEFPPGHTVAPGLFIARNRLISALSRGVLVVEGSKKSGALITARYAAEQGRDVFAIPGQITSEFAEAPNLLIKEGAKPVTCTSDILDEYELELKTGIQTGILMNLTDTHEKKIYDILLGKPKKIDEIAQESGILINRLLSIVSSLEIQGFIEKTMEEEYRVRQA